MGRPVELDRNYALQQAKDLFWSQGYAATSISDLVSATNMQPGSLYGAFKNKKSLYLQALQRYGEEETEKLTAVLTEAASPLEGIKSLFFATVEICVEDPRGCLLANTITESATHDPEMREQANMMITTVETLLAETIVQAQQQGQLSREKDPKALAKYLLANIIGMRVMSKMRPSKENLEGIMQNTLSVLN